MYQANERENPLHIELLSSPYPNGKFTNRRGRPTTENVIKFGPQPKSMIAQMLCNMKSKNHSTPRTSATICTKDDQSVIEKSMTKVKKTFSNSDRSDDTTEHKQCLAAHKKFSCDFPDCSYSCKLSSNLIKHKRTHTSERPYLCDRCSFRSNFINSLKAHQRVHTSERPYQCKYCDYKCISSSNLKKHCVRRHPNTC